MTQSKARHPFSSDQHVRQFAASLPHLALARCHPVKQISLLAGSGSPQCSMLLTLLRHALQITIHNCRQRGFSLGAPAVKPEVEWEAVPDPLPPPVQIYAGHRGANKGWANIHKPP